MPHEASTDGARCGFLYGRVSAGRSHARGGGHVLTLPPLFTHLHHVNYHHHYHSLLTFIPTSPSTCFPSHLPFIVLYLRYLYPACGSLGRALLATSQQPQGRQPQLRVAGSGHPAPMVDSSSWENSPPWPRCTGENHTGNRPRLSPLLHSITPGSALTQMVATSQPWSENSSYTSSPDLWCHL